MREPDLQRYIDFYENLAPDQRDPLLGAMSADVHFVDPFNDVTGRDKVRLIFMDMFRYLESPKFNITHAARITAPERSALMRWELHATVRGGHESIRIVGMSEVYLTADGLIHEHIDHWDSGRQFYERIPLLGWLLRRVRARFLV